MARNEGAADRGPRDAGGGIAPEPRRADIRELYENEKERRRQAEAQLERLRGQVEHYQEILAVREREVRYRLGDALVRAAKPSLDTVKLPFRIASLFAEGLKRSLARRRENRSSHGGFSREPGTGYGGVAALAQPFGTAPPEMRRRDDVRMATVTDEFSWWAWQFEAQGFTFRPEDWRKALERRKPDLLFIESAWKGIDDSWYHQLRHLGSRGEEAYVLPEVVAWCRQRDIPTVFYSKEDPPNFDVFIDAAARFDHVFTSDANCVPEYRKRVGHDRVFALPFAAQPRIHHPVVTGEARIGSVCFAGTWYNNRHKDRQADAISILRPALDFDLHIFDRMAGRPSASYRWPDEFLPAIRGSLPYAQMLSAYKRYKVFLNVNSVKNSPTMFSRRVFELLACGTPVISSYSEGIEELLGDDVVLLSDNERTTRQLLERILGDDEYRERLSLRGQRRVFRDHTYTHRLQFVLDTIGLRRPVAGRAALTMVAPVEDADQLAGAWENYRRQTYENKRLVICGTLASAVTGADCLTGGDETVRVITAQDAPWGPALQEAVQGCEDGSVVAMNPVDYYGPHYLTDYANALLFVTERAIGKAAFYRAGPGGEPTIAGTRDEYRITGRVHPWTLCLAKEEAIRAGQRAGSVKTPGDWWNRVEQRFDRIYSADRFNYVQQGVARSGASESAALDAGFGASEPHVMRIALA